MMMQARLSHPKSPLECQRPGTSPYSSTKNDCNQNSLSILLSDLPLDKVIHSSHIPNAVTDVDLKFIGESQRLMSGICKALNLKIAKRILSLISWIFKDYWETHSSRWAKVHENHWRLLGWVSQPGFESKLYLLFTPMTLGNLLSLSKPYFPSL